MRSNTDWQRVCYPDVRRWQEDQIPPCGLRLGANFYRLIETVTFSIAECTLDRKLIWQFWIAMGLAVDSENLERIRREVQLKQVKESVAELLQRYDATLPEQILQEDGIRLLRQCENNCELLRHYDSAASKYYRENIAEFAELSMLYGHLLRSGATIPMGVCHLGGELHYGLITLVNLQKNDFIGLYAGIIQVSDGGLAHENRPGYSSDYAWDYPEFPADWPDIEISAENAGNALRYANHSFDPNCRVEHTLLEGIWQLFFLADQDIPAGEQLLVNYGEEYWRNDLRELVYI